MLPKSVNDCFGKWADPLATIAVIAGMISWLVTSYTQIQDNSEKIDRLETNFTAYKVENHTLFHEFEDKMGENSKKLSRIEGKLDTILDFMDKK